MKWKGQLKIWEILSDEGLCIELYVKLRVLELSGIKVTLRDFSPVCSQQVGKILIHIQAGTLLRVSSSIRSLPAYRAVQAALVHTPGRNSACCMAEGKSQSLSEP